jgi:predicted RNase H-like HicB family nuclease
MYIATMDAGKFEFTALGNTREGAIAAMREGWDLHIRQMCADGTVDPECMTPASEIENYYGVNVAWIKLGQCLRDREPLEA